MPRIISHAAHASLRQVRCDCQDIKDGDICPICEYDPAKEREKLEDLMNEIANSGDC